MNKKLVKKEITFGGKKLSFETGELAFMANMAVKATYGDTVILVTVCSGEANPDINFFPLTVNYEEKLYAGGLIKSSRFVKRDGRATDDAVMSKRLIDHAIRPLFPHDYMDAVQVVATVLSLDDTADPEFLAMNAVSAALAASDISWSGPMVSARVAYVNGEFTLSAPKEDMEEKSDLSMTISFVGPEKKFLAIEARANILPEEKVLGAIDYARENLAPVYDLIQEFAKEVNPTNAKYPYVSKALDEEMLKSVDEVATEEIRDMMRSELDKTTLTERQDKLRDDVFAKFEGKFKKADMLRAIEELEKRAIQHVILEEGKRPDGRGINDIRPISAQVGLLPRTHGSALFSRGVTQVLTVVTLGSPSMQLIIQNMYGEDTKRYIHYYNFPPYASGETGNMGAPKSREIGHGMLAEKGLMAVLPDEKTFPYMTLLVSETLSSSGSSSMAATCASTLALMDAGVPIKDMVAGIGVGIIINDDFSKYKIMTDLAYMEDAFGFLDFKMSGTRKGVTAIQADMKAAGIPIELVPRIFEQSREARMKVLDEMEKVLAKPREAVSQYAPKMMTLQIKPEQIGSVIGSGGKTIKEIQEKTNTVVAIDDDGSTVVTGANLTDVQKAAAIIDGMTREIKVGEVYDGTVVDLLDFGALVEILPGRVGLMHISEITNDYVKTVDEWFKPGDKVTVKVINTSEDGKIGLSKRVLEPGYNAEEDKQSHDRPDSGGRGRFSGHGGGGGRRGGFSHDRGPRRDHR